MRVVLHEQSTHGDHCACSVYTNRVRGDHCACSTCYMNKVRMVTTVRVVLAIYDASEKCLHINISIPPRNNCIIYSNVARFVMI